MRIVTFYVMACLLAGLVPVLVPKSHSSVSTIPFPGWPAHFEGQTLKEIPLSSREKHFTEGFPGRIAKFTDGRRELVMRWVTEETRKLHPAGDCFQGIGFSVHPLPLKVDSSGNRWGCFEATSGKEKFQVCERIYDDETGMSWSDVSAWYWAVISGQTRGPWWAVTLAEKKD